MIAFCHIPKTAGMAVKHILKSNFGTRFLASTTWGKGRPMTTARDLRYELLPYPRAVAIGGHGIRPFVDYGDRGRSFKWITILRDPVARIFSHYVYDFELGRTQESFEGWIKGDVANYQVRWLAGEEDLSRAKELLESKFVFVGLQEHFRESLVLLKHLAFDDRLRLSSERRVNATKSVQLKEELHRQVDQYRQVIEERCGLDLQLYEYARVSIWEKQVQCLGSAELERRLAVEFPEAGAGDYGKLRRSLHEVHRNTAYKPVLWLARALRARS